MRNNCGSEQPHSLIFADISQGLKADYKSTLQGECEQELSVSLYCTVRHCLPRICWTVTIVTWVLLFCYPTELPQGMWEQDLQGSCSFHGERWFLSPHPFLLPVSDFMICRVLSNLTLPLEDEVPALTDWEELIFHLNTSCHPRLVAWPSTSAGQFSFRKTSHLICSVNL